MPARQQITISIKFHFSTKRFSLAALLSGILERRKTTKRNVFKYARSQKHLPPMHLFQKASRRGTSQCEGVNKERQRHVIQEAGTQYKREAEGLPRMTMKGEAGGQLCIDMGAASPDGQVRRFQEEFLPEGETDKSIRYF